MDHRSFLPALALLSLGVAACGESPTVSPTDTRIKKAGGSGTTAAPAIAYLDTVSTKSKGTTTVYGAIKVMDADGANRTSIYRGPIDSYSPTTIQLGAGAWAPSGTGTASSPWKLAFAEKTTSGWDVRTISVYVSSTGAATGTGGSTIVSASADIVRAPAWSPSRSELVYATSTNVTGGASSEAFLVTLQGTTTRIFPAAGTPSLDLNVYDVAFSPTGDTIALAILDTKGDAVQGNDEVSIRLIDRSGTELATLSGTTAWYSVSGIDFNRAGDLAIAAKVVLSTDGDGNVTSASPFEVYTIDVSSASATKQFPGVTPSWSSDGSAVAYKLNAGISVRSIGATTGTTLNTSGVRPAWRR